MPDALPASETEAPRVSIRLLTTSDCDEFVTVAQASSGFHRPWLELPTTPEQFEEYLRRRQTCADICFVVCEYPIGRIIGGINMSCIVRGCFQSACLRYWIGAPFARRGYMEEGLRLLVRHAFSELGLHRLEANIQPENVASIALVRKCGFRREGFSLRYLKIGSEWRDHERWALLADEIGAQ